MSTSRSRTLKSYKNLKSEKRQRETSDTKFVFWNTYRITHKTQQHKYNQQQLQIENQGSHLPRKPSRSRMRSFIRIALCSFIFHVCLRLFRVLYCFGGRKQISEWKRTTKATSALSEPMEIIKITKSTSESSGIQNSNFETHIE